MRGAPELSVAGALRAGAGMVRVGDAGRRPRVRAARPRRWRSGSSGRASPPVVLAEVDRCRALVAGPGLGSDARGASRRCFEILEQATVPVVLDADALNMLGGRKDAAAVLRRRGGPTILTPHDGEFARLERRAARRGPRRRGARARGGVRRDGAVEGLDDGRRRRRVVRRCSSPPGRRGSRRREAATSCRASSGRCSHVASRRSVAAGIGAHLHGRAARTGLADGLVAGDLPLLVAGVLSSSGAAIERRSLGAGGPPGDESTDGRHRRSRGARVERRAPRPPRRTGRGDDRREGRRLRARCASRRHRGDRAPGRWRSPSPSSTRR